WYQTMLLEWSITTRPLTFQKNFVLVLSNKINLEIEENLHEIPNLSLGMHWAKGGLAWYWGGCDEQYNGIIDKNIMPHKIWVVHQERLNGENMRGTHIESTPIEDTTKKYLLIESSTAILHLVLHHVPSSDATFGPAYLVILYYPTGTKHRFL
ncbi:hypothetical protein ACJX0J_030412, partial [Zea mays]